MRFIATLILLLTLPLTAQANPSQQYFNELSECAAYVMLSREMTDDDDWQSRETYRTQLRLFAFHSKIIWEHALYMPVDDFMTAFSHNSFDYYLQMRYILNNCPERKPDLDEVMAQHCMDMAFEARLFTTE